MEKNSLHNITKLLFEVILPLVNLLRAEIRIYAPQNLSFPQFRVQANISLGVSTVSEIAEHVGVSQPAMTKMTNGLEKACYLRREKDQIDKRQFLLIMSNKSERLYDNILSKTRLKTVEKALKNLKGIDL